MKYECHGHIILDGNSYQEAMRRHSNGVDTDFLRSQMKRCAEYGIGYYRDGGDKLMVSAAALSIARDYGIDYRTPIYIIHRQGFYGSMFGQGYDDIRGYRELVGEAKRLGADFIKLAVSGIMDFASGGNVTGPSLELSEIKEAVRIAHGEGLQVMAHVNGAACIKNALTAGVSSIEHGFWPDAECVELFCQTGAVWVPTRVTVKNLIGTGRFNDSVLKNILDVQKLVLLQARDRCVPIATGSDCGAALVMQGKGTQEEYEELRQLGIDPEQGNRKIAELFRGLQ
jgi:imidazolonepropionase-like amidohydrolase